MNPKFNKLIDAMLEYDKSDIGSIERDQYGKIIDKEASNIKERDRISIESEFNKRKGV